VQRIPYFENLFPKASQVFGIPGSATQAIYTLIARSAVGGDDVTDFLVWKNGKCHGD
jgi:hypothetical protein